MRRDLITLRLAIVVFTVLLGLAYPLLTTGVAQVVWPNKADGSQIERNGKVVGSRLIGQDFSGRGGSRYFQSRPSVTDYSPDATFFNNLGPNNAELRTLFEENLAGLSQARTALQPGPPGRRRAAGRGADRGFWAWIPTSHRTNAEIQARAWPRRAASGSSACSS